MERQSLYRFGTCEVDARLRLVRRDGEVMDAQPRVFDLLLYLIEHRDRVVDKDELLGRLWPGVVVSEQSLTQGVRKARALVGDDGSRQNVIRTVQRRGFRFVAALEEIEATAGFRDAAVTADESSVAVLPFVDMSPQHDAEYFADGMSEEIINELTRNPRLRVAARTSAFVFKNGRDDVREIGRRLGVATVLEGSVRKQEDRLRVTAQLIDARTGFHLWSERWDRRVEDMLAIQDEIARLISAALREPPGAGSAAASTPEELYRRGMAYLHRSGQRSQRFAIDLFNQALHIDPSYAGAWAGIAISRIVLSRPLTEAHVDAAAEAMEKAMSCDRRSPEAWTARAIVAQVRGDSAAARKAFEQAIEYGPGLFEAYYYYGDACIETGSYAQAAELYERASELRPDDYQALVFAAQAYRSLGQSDRALDAARRQLGAAERALAYDPTDARALSLSAGSLIAVGRVEEAREWIGRACALEPDEPYVHYNAACHLALIGDVDGALATLERIGPAGLCRLPWVEHDEDLVSLRDEPRFRALFAELS